MISLEYALLMVPSWWTLGHTIAMLGAVAVAAVLELAWVVTLKRRVREQTDAIRAALAHESSLQQRHRDLFDNASDIVYTTDLHGNFTSLNKAGEMLTGYSSAEARVMNIADIVRPEMREMVLDQLERAAAGEDLPPLETDIISRSGRTKTVEINARAILRDGQPRELEAIARDVTEKKRIREELKRTQEAAEAASKAKSEFLANMSHEIRTPMNGVIGLMELVLGTRLSAEQRNYLETARNSARHLLTVINDVLDFSKVEAGKLELDPQPFCLRAVIGEAADTVAVRARQKGVDLRWDTCNDVPDALVGDPARLRQVLLNLLGNAIKFTDKGSVVLDVLREPSHEDAVLLHFRVRDTGVGIAEDKLAVIFDAFAQADGSSSRRHGGTGLGLAISAKLVELLGGRIWAESRVAQGSAFHFTVQMEMSTGAPVPDCRSTARLAQSLALAQRPAGALRVLVAEDNLVNQMVAVKILEKRGHVAIVAADGLAVLKALEQGPFDVILMDIQMPELDGIEAAAEIRRREAAGRLKGRIPIVAMTAHALCGDRDRCLGAGMDDYVAKPVQPADMLQKVEHWARQASLDAISPR